MATEPLPQSRVVLEDLFDQCAKCLGIAERVAQRDERRVKLLLRFADGEIPIEEVQRHGRILEDTAELSRNEYKPQIDSLWPYCDRKTVAKAKFYHAFGAEAVAEGFERVKDDPIFGNLVAAGVMLAARGQMLYICLLGELRARLLLAIDQLSGVESEKPIWNSETNKLTFRGKVVRTTRGRRIAGRIHFILDQFHAQNWDEHIAAPPNFDPQTLRESVQTLNDGLTDIRFRSDGTGEGVIWEIRQP